MNPYINQMIPSYSTNMNLYQQLSQQQQQQYQQPQQSNETHQQRLLTSYQDKQPINQPIITKQQQTNPQIFQQTIQHSVIDQQNNFQQKQNQVVQNTIYSKNQQQQQVYYQNKQSKGSLSNNMNSNNSSGSHQNAVNNNQNTTITTNATTTSANNTTQMRAGDWICLICNNLNFSFRNECNRCHMQTKQQNFLQSLMIHSQQNSNLNSQPNLLQGQQFNASPQYPQSYPTQSQQQKYQYQNQKYIQLNQQGDQQQIKQIPFLNLLKPNNPQFSQQDKENQDPGQLFGNQLNYSAINGGYGQIPQNVGSCQNNEKSQVKLKQNQSYHIQENNNNSICQTNQEDNPFFSNFNQIQDSFNRNNNNNNNNNNNKNNNTPLFLIPQQTNNNLNELNQCYNIQQYQQFQQQHYNQQQNQQQYCSHPVRQQQIQLFKSHSNFNEQQIQQSDQQNQSDFISSNFQQGIGYPPYFSPSSNAFQQQQQQLQQFAIKNEFQQQHNYLNAECFEQQQIHQQSQNQIKAGQRSHQLIGYPPQINQQDLSQQQFQNSHYFPQQIHHQFYQDQQIQRQQINQNYKECEYQEKQHYGVVSYNQNQHLQSTGQFDNSNNQGNNLIINNNPTNKKLECFFDNQINFNDFKFENQKKSSQLLQENNNQQKQVNLNQKQISHSYLHDPSINNNNTNINHNINNKENQQNSQDKNTNNDNANNNQQDQSLNPWFGTQKGFENRLLVTPPKTKQYLSQNQQLSDIENMINQFKFMYSTEKKSQVKSIASHDSEKQIQKFGSLQKQPQQLEQYAYYSSKKKEGITEKQEITLENNSNIKQQQSQSNQQKQEDYYELQTTHHQLQFSSQSKLQIQQQSVSLISSNHKKIRLIFECDLEDKIQIQFNNIDQQKNEQTLDNEQSTNISLSTNQVLSKQGTSEKEDNFIFSCSSPQFQTSNNDENQTINNNNIQKDQKFDLSQKHSESEQSQLTLKQKNNSEE